jgi:hypothetical protein
VYLRAEHQIAELSVGQKHNEKHYGKASHVLGASAQGHAELGHCLVEADIFEYFNPRQKDHNGHGRVEHVLPVAEKLKAHVLIVVLKQALEQVGHRHLSVNVEADADSRYYEYDNVEYVPDAFEIAQLVLFNLFFCVAMVKLDSKTKTQPKI